MKLFNILFIIVLVLWAYSSFTTRDDELWVPDEDLITNFEQYQIVSRKEWHRGRNSNNTQVLVAYKKHAGFQSVWTLGEVESSVAVQTLGDDPELDSVFAAGQCYQLAKVVMDDDSHDIADGITVLFKNVLSSVAGSENALRASGEIGDRTYHVSVRVSGPALIFMCTIETG